MVLKKMTRKNMFPRSIFFLLRSWIPYWVGTNLEEEFRVDNFFNSRSVSSNCVGRSSAASCQGKSEKEFLLGGGGACFCSKKDGQKSICSDRTIFFLLLPGPLVGCLST